MLDVRFLPNPFFVKDLAPLTGEDEEVARSCWRTRTPALFVDKADDLLRCR